MNEARHNLEALFDVRTSAHDAVGKSSRSSKQTLKTRPPASSHLQRLTSVENGGTSVWRAENAINQRFPNPPGAIPLTHQLPKNRGSPLDVIPENVAGSDSLLQASKRRL